LLLLFRMYSHSFDCAQWPSAVYCYMFLYISLWFAVIFQSPELLRHLSGGDWDEEEEFVHELARIFTKGELAVGFLRLRR